MILKLRMYTLHTVNIYDDWKELSDINTSKRSRCL